MARLSIYVTDELKARMDEVGDDVNWSEIVRPSIQVAVATHEQRRSRDMTTAIERLRATKEEAKKEDIEAGKADGRSWAEQHATYKELRRVSEIQDGCFDYSNLKRAIDPDDDWAMSDFVEQVFRVEEEPTDEYIEGFIEGAQQFFAEVRDQL